MRPVKLDRTGLLPIVEPTLGADAVRGHPLRRTWSCYEAADGGFDCGVWECESGAYRLEFQPGTEECFVVVSGRIRILGDDGTSIECTAGEGGVIPPGFRGVVDVIEPVRKYFVFSRRRLSWGGLGIFRSPVAAAIACEPA
jgi:uncharacterized cupin superfamily protein